MDDAVEPEISVDGATSVLDTLPPLAPQDTDIDDAAVDDGWGDDGFGDFAEADDTIATDMVGSKKLEDVSDSSHGGFSTKLDSSGSPDILRLDKDAFQAAAAAALHKFLPHGHIHTPSAGICTLKDLEYQYDSLKRPTMKDDAATKLSIPHWKESTSAARLLFRLNLGPQPTPTDAIPALGARPSSRQKLLPALPTTAPEPDTLPPAVKLHAPPQARLHSVEAPSSLLRTPVPSDTLGVSNTQQGSVDIFGGESHKINGTDAAALSLPAAAQVPETISPIVVAELLDNPENEEQKEGDSLMFGDENTFGVVPEDSDAVWVDATKHEEEEVEVIAAEAVELDLMADAFVEDNGDDDDAGSDGFGDFAQVPEIENQEDDEILQEDILQEDDMKEALPVVYVENKDDAFIFGQGQSNEDAAEGVAAFANDAPTSLHTEAEAAQDLDRLPSTEFELEETEEEERNQQHAVEADIMQGMASDDGDAAFNSFMGTSQESENEDAADLNKIESGATDAALDVSNLFGKEEEEAEKGEEPPAAAALEDDATIREKDLDLDPDSWQNHFEGNPIRTDVADVPSSLALPEAGEATIVAGEDENENETQEEEGDAGMDFSTPGMLEEKDPHVEQATLQEFDDDDFDDFCEAPASVPDTSAAMNGNIHEEPLVTAAAVSEPSLGVVDSFVAQMPDLSFMLSDELAKPS